MKNYNLENFSELNNSELFDICGGQDPIKPHGIFQWAGYYYEQFKSSSIISGDFIPPGNTTPLPVY
jgi:COMC family